MAMSERQVGKNQQQRAGGGRRKQHGVAPARRQAVEIFADDEAAKNQHQGNGPEYAAKQFGKR